MDVEDEEDFSTDDDDDVSISVALVQKILSDAESSQNLFNTL